MMACLDREELIKKLVSDSVLKPGIEELNTDGFTQLHRACEQGNNDLVAQLLKCHANVRALHIASKHGVELVVTRLLEFDAVKDIDKGDSSGNTPLHLAAANDNVNILKKLFQAFCNEFQDRRPVDLRNGNLQTPLHLAACNGNLGSVVFLLQEGAYRSSRDIAGLTPFDYVKHIECPSRLELMERLRVSPDEAKGDSLNYERWNRLEDVSFDELEGEELVRKLVYHGVLTRGIEEGRGIDGLTPLLECIINGQQKLVELLLKCHAKVHAGTTDPTRSTALHMLAFYGRESMLNNLMVAEALKDIDSKDHKGNTPLHIAASHGNINILRAYFQAFCTQFPYKRPVDLRNGARETPLHLAALRGNSDAVDFLLEQGADRSARSKDESTPYDYADECGCQSSNVVEMLKEKLRVGFGDKTRYSWAGLAKKHFGVRVLNYAAFNEKRDGFFDEFEGKELIGKLEAKGILTRGIEEASAEEGLTPLLEAIAVGEEKLVELLLRCNANVHASPEDPTKSTALHMAASFGSISMVTKLLATHAIEDLQTKDFKGNTPLHIAAMNRNFKIFQAFFDKFCDRFPNEKAVDLLNNKHQTPLHLAARKGISDAVNLLLKYGADKRCRDVDGLTPFHFGAKCRGYTKVFLIEKLMVDVDETSNDGFTALHYAAKKGCSNTVSILLQNKASVNLIGGANGDTPLHLAAQTAITRDRQSDVIARLIRSGADVCASNTNGQLPIDLADGNSNVVKQFFYGMMNSKNKSINPMATYKHGATLLHYSAAYGTQKHNTWVVERICGKHMANLNLKDQNGRTPMHWAAIRGNVDAIETLAKSNMDLLATDNEHITPLCFALIHEQLEFAEKLINCLGQSLTPEQWLDDIERWVDTFKSIVEDYLHTNNHSNELIREIPPMYIALHAGKERTAMFIQRHGRVLQDILNMRGRITGRTALHWATILNQRKIVSLLCKTAEFEKDLMANIPDNAGKVPFDYATKMEMVKELMQRGDVQSYQSGLYRDRQDGANAILVGAALIASVTFGGWLQPPKPYNGILDTHVQVLELRAFWIFNSLSFFFAIASVLAAGDAMLPMPNFYIAAALSSIRNAVLFAAGLLAISIFFVLGAFTVAGLLALPSLKYQTDMMSVVIVGGLTCLYFLIKFIGRLYEFRPKCLKTLEKQMLVLYGQLCNLGQDSSGQLISTNVQGGIGQQNVSSRPGQGDGDETLSEYSGISMCQYLKG